MLVEYGFTRVIDEDGREWSFTPAFSRLASIGDPRQIVRTYAELHGPQAHREAAYVLACLCDQEDALEAAGWLDEALTWHQGSIPADDVVSLARHLMRHAIIGKSKPGQGGEYSDKFDVAEYISAARVHLGLSSEDAGALSMTEFQSMLEMKFPDMKAKEVPTKEEYELALSELEKVRSRALAKQG